MACLSLLMLGPFQVYLDGHPISWFESCKARALLAYLAVESHRPHPRTCLAELLWPDRPESAALANLRHALANLRRVLGDHRAPTPFVRAGRDCLQFNPDSSHRTDLQAFTQLVMKNSHDSPNYEQLEHAVGLCQGDFLEQLELEECPGFEEWVLIHRESCDWLLATALRLLCDHYVLARHYEKAVAFARRIVRQDPWDEVGHQQLMRALALAGHRGDALCQYADCQRLLRLDLQVEPGPSTTALYEAIRDGTIGDGTKRDARLEQPAAQIGLNPSPRRIRDRHPSIQHHRNRCRMPSSMAAGIRPGGA
jgi:DNA-binding SARP family transcriptional activator